ncbi:MAG TPA: L-threonylcarbamoyladenylate synthase [Chitinophagaceae bacterium]|nr:L-threonylcarbamoyladenylate synthase [Chitinophagaceae bacterium]
MINTDIKETLSALKKGKIILYPTDTIWGIGCDATNAEAINRIYQLKQRDDSKSMIILTAENRDVLKYTASPHPEIFNILENATKPTTIIYENALGLPENLINADGSIAIRVVQEPFCKALIKRLGHPIVSTSANISGQPPAPFFSAISREIKEGVEYIVQYRQEDETPASPSRIIKLKNNGEVDIIRE